jgi:hypothetical protein
MKVLRVSNRLHGLALMGVLAFALTGCPHPGPPPRTSTTTTTTGSVPGRLPGVVALKDFRAVVDKRAPEHKLVVTGTVIVASGQYVVRLEPANPQGINPDILLVRLVVTKLDGNFVTVQLPRPVRLEASPNYEQVTVLDVGLDLRVTPA